MIRRGQVIRLPGASPLLKHTTNHYTALYCTENETTTLNILQGNCMFQQWIELCAVGVELKGVECALQLWSDRSATSGIPLLPLWQCRVE